MLIKKLLKRTGMEEPILHEQTSISPIMLSIIVHSALVLFFIIEMNLRDSATTSQQRPAEVIMMPQEQPSSAQQMSQTSLAPQEAAPEQKQPENVLENFPSFKQLPNSPSASEDDEFDAQPEAAESVQKTTLADDALSTEAEEVVSGQEEYEETIPAPEMTPQELPMLAQQQWPTSLVQEAEPAPAEIQSTKKTVEKLQAPSQKKLSLADIGKKYQEYLHEERASNAKGIAGVTILGNDDLVPTGEQIKHARFMEKLSAQVQKAWSRNRHAMHNAGEFTAEYYVVLNKDGSLRTFKLRKSSGNREVDEFIVKVYYDASSSFPPIPDNFKLDSYGFNIIVTLYPYIDQGPLRFSSSWN
jgi:hypothetical protein